MSHGHFGTHQSATSPIHASASSLLRGLPTRGGSQPSSAGWAATIPADAEPDTADPSSADDVEARPAGTFSAAPPGSPTSAMAAHTDQCETQHAGSQVSKPAHATNVELKVLPGMHSGMQCKSFCSRATARSASRCKVGPNLRLGQSSQNFNGYEIRPVHRGIPTAGGQAETG